NVLRSAPPCVSINAALIKFSLQITRKKRIKETVNKAGEGYGEARLNLSANRLIYFLSYSFRNGNNPVCLETLRSVPRGPDFSFGLRRSVVHRELKDSSQHVPSVPHSHPRLRTLVTKTLSAIHTFWTEGATAWAGGGDSAGGSWKRTPRGPVLQRREGAAGLRGRPSSELQRPPRRGPSQRLAEGRGPSLLCG
ncbi:hypothetical protein P7K49_024869, partial [Saguinus oedipus]